MDFHVIKKPFLDKNARFRPKNHFERTILYQKRFRFESKNDFSKQKRLTLRLNDWVQKVPLLAQTVPFAPKKYQFKAFFNQNGKFWTENAIFA